MPDKIRAESRNQLSARCICKRTKRYYIASCCWSRHEHKSSWRKLHHRRKIVLCNKAFPPRNRNKHSRFRIFGVSTSLVRLVFSTQRDEWKPPISLFGRLYERNLGGWAASFRMASIPAAVVPRCARQPSRSGRSRPLSQRQLLEIQPSRPAAASLAFARHSSITWGGVRR